MKPDFALSLSFEGISLLQRADGGWFRLGEVALDDTDLRGALGELRESALLASPGGVRVKLVVPNEQIRYLTIETGTLGGAARQEMARTALDGATPYAVNDLVFDLAPDDDHTHIAAVARDTLSEAEAFAIEHGFDPVSFVAVPGDNIFPGEPFFGPTRHAGQTLGDDAVEPDGISIHVIERTAAPRIAPEPEPEIAGEDSQPIAPEPVAFRHIERDPVPPAPATPGFSSRRTRTENVAPALAGARRDSPPPPASGFSPLPEISEPDLTAQEAEHSVTAPTLDIPDPDPVEPEPQTPMGIVRFLSRRQRRNSPPVRNPAPVAVADPDAPPPLPAPVAPDLQPADETARMTVFGARKTDPAAIGGKPRHLGLILTAVLLAFLAAVAAWAALFLDDEMISRLFPDRPDETELAAEPDPPESVGPVSLPDKLENPVLLPPDSGTDQALVSPSEPDTTVTAPASPDQPTLTDTDVAVLDALRNGDETGGIQDPDNTDLQPEPDPETGALTGPVEDLLPPPATESENPHQAEATYAATGIWQDAPAQFGAQSVAPPADTYVPAIDGGDSVHDAIALSGPQDFQPDLALPTIGPPATAGARFDIRADGLVEPTAKGTLNPDGILVYLGKPPAVPASFPTRFETEPDAEIVADLLRKKRPRQRPATLVEDHERRRLGGRTRAELAAVRPRIRPHNAKRDAERDERPTAQAVVVSRVPLSRPKGFEGKIRQASVNASTKQTDALVNSNVEQRSVTPKIPTSASVARQATLDNAINLHRLNLIGVYGTVSNRRALVRLPSGRYRKVKVGDKVDGGRIVAIGDSELRYQKGGRNVTLKIPSG